MEHKKNYGITVVIPAYNEEASILETIHSIQSQTVPIQKILVVDDFSSDKTGEIATNAGATVVRTHANQGTKAAAQQYVLMRGHVDTELFVTIDGDTILHPEAIEKCLRYFDEDPLTGSVCGFVIPARIKTIWERGRFVEYTFGLSVFKSAQNHVHAVMVSSGCFSVFRTEFLMNIGGFNAETMAEDMYATWQFWANGYHVYYEKEAYCYPYDPPTMKIFVSQIDRWYRSFFQNIEAHWKNLFKNNKKVLGFILAYLVEGLISPLIILVGFLFFFRSGDPLRAMFLAVSIDFLIVASFSLWEGLRIKKFWQIFFSLPAYTIIRPVNFFVFWRSLYKEWVKRETLGVWVKGH